MVNSVHPVDSTGETINIFVLSFQFPLLLCWLSANKLILSYLLLRFMVIYLSQFIDSHNSQGHQTL